MADDVKIGEMPELEAPDDEDNLIVGDVSAVKTKRTTVANMRTAIGISSAERSKLAGVEAGADVTDSTNVAAAGAVMDGDFAGTHPGTMHRVGAGLYQVRRDTYDATAAPAVGDDDADGYAAGSIWVWPDHGIWICEDASTGAAEWRELWPGRGSATIDATTARDMTDADHGLVVLFSDDTGPCIVTVLADLLPGTTAEYVQAGDGQVQIEAGDGVTLIFDEDFDPYTAARGGSIVVTALDGTFALVRGSLAAATP